MLVWVSSLLDMDTHRHLLWVVDLVHPNDSLWSFISTWLETLNIMAVLRVIFYSTCTEWTVSRLTQCFDSAGETLQLSKITIAYYTILWFTIYGVLILIKILRKCKEKTVNRKPWFAHYTKGLLLLKLCFLGKLLSISRL